MTTGAGGRCVDRLRLLFCPNGPQVNYKWLDPALLKEGFVPFPKTFLRCLSQLWLEDKEIEQLAVILAIVDYRRPQMTRPPSSGLLAFTAGLSQEAFEIRLAELKQAGFLDFYGTPQSLQISLTPLVETVKQMTLDEG